MILDLYLTMYTCETVFNQQKTSISIYLAISVDAHSDMTFTLS